MKKKMKSSHHGKYWLDELKKESNDELKKYFAPEAIVKMLIPTAFILALGTIGALFADIVGFGIGSLIGRVMIGATAPKKIEDAHSIDSEASTNLAIAKPPGAKLLKAIEIVVSKDSFEKTFQPIVADWQGEYFQALDKKRGKLKLFFINARHTWAFLDACGVFSFLKVLSKLFSKYRGA